MRNKRHDAISELISSRNIETQKELTDALSRMGFDVTQATVSRDIKELRLIKRVNDSGKYVYMQGGSHSESEMTERMAAIFNQCVISADYATNTIVLKTLTGMAQGAAAALDAMHYPEILGTIAGDDTIFVVSRSEEAAQRFCRKITSMIG